MTAIPGGPPDAAPSPGAVAKGTPVPTAPGALPLLGHALPLLRDPVGLLQSIRAYGDIVRVRIGPAQVYVLNSPALVRQVLAADVETYRKGSFNERFRPYQGDSLFTIDGPGHRRRRRVVQPAFHRDRLKTYAEVMREVAATRFAGWTEGRPIDVGAEMYALTSEVVARVLFGGEIGSERIARIQRWLPVFVRGMGRKVVTPAGWLDRLPIPANRRFDAAQHGLRTLVDGLVREQIAARGPLKESGEAGETGGEGRQEGRGGRERGDLLSLLVGSRDPESGRPLSATQLRDETMTFMTAGIETVATTLTWLHHELAVHPEVRARLLDEVDTALGGRPAGFDDLPSLPYTRSVVRETLRLHSPAWILTRRPTAPVRLGTALLPAGAELLFSPATLHRDPAIYPRPAEFLPGREHEESGPAPCGHGGDRPADAARPPYLPFSTGPYKCVGDHFALTQLALTVATLAQRWRLESASARAPREIAGAALSPDRVVMTPRQRDHQAV
ncbi:cytochrome P450 [Streptomyces sp. NPDC048718]|uniref:cytochrome P450 n=1 Tax=Streptomyces sp. NPDC048718 TaxID=3365587 RepID=UPI00371BBE33